MSEVEQQLRAAAATTIAAAPDGGASGATTLLPELQRMQQQILRLTTLVESSYVGPVYQALPAGLLASLAPLLAQPSLSPVLASTIGASAAPNPAGTGDSGIHAAAGHPPHVLHSQPFTAPAAQSISPSKPSGNRQLRSKGSDVPSLPPLNAAAYSGNAGQGMQQQGRLGAVPQADPLPPLVPHVAGFNGRTVQHLHRVQQQRDGLGTRRLG